MRESMVMFGTATEPVEDQMRANYFGLKNMDMAVAKSNTTSFTT